jgi:hypothetical protein
MIAAERLECRSCGTQLRAKTEEEQILKGRDWAIAAFPHPDHPLGLLICPRCTKLPPETVLSRYQERVSSGLDLQFH